MSSTTVAGSPDPCAHLAATLEASPTPDLHQLQIQQSPQPYVSHVAWRRKLVIILVGLPARGKSFVGVKIVSWMRWRGQRAELFNVGKLRRQKVNETQDASFFSANNQQAAETRDALAFAVLDNMIDWMRNGGDLAVLDATNTTRKRRAEVLRRIQAVSPVLPVCFIESICNDPVVLRRNYQAKVNHSPDYASNPDKDAAMADLLARIANYEKVYEPLDEGEREDFSYVKLINLASKCVCNKIYGTLMHAVTSFLMSIHVQPRPIFLSRAGKCVGATDETRLYKSSNNSSAPYVTSFSSSNDPPPSVSYSATPMDQARPSNLPEPLLITYSQDEAASLDRVGKNYSQVMNDFVAEKVLSYWHTHLVSKRARNTDDDSETNQTDPIRAEAGQNAIPDVGLSPNEVAIASVFSPPDSGPSSPLLGSSGNAAGASPPLLASSSLGGATPIATIRSMINVMNPTSSGFSPFIHSRAPLTAAASASASPPTPSMPAPASSPTASGQLPERSTAIIGSGSMVLTLERSHTNDTLPVIVYTSTLPRALQTVTDISERALYVQQQSSLNAVDHGTLTGLTIDQIRTAHPDKFQEWMRSRYTFRFPGGESQQDKARSMESFIMEIERQLFPVLIVSHASTLQIICGYFSTLVPDQYSSIEIPQHVLIELVPTQYGWLRIDHDLRSLTNQVGAGVSPAVSPAPAALAAPAVN